MRSLIVIFSLIASCAHAASPTEWLVVEERMEAIACCSFNGEQNSALAAKNIHLVFTPSEVVRILKTSGENALVLGSTSDVSAWVKRSNLVGPDSFRPLYKWSGQTRFKIFSASYDSGQEYSFAKDGAFKASFDDNHKPRKWSGHLHSYKQLIWAKPAATKASFGAWSVFQLKNDGTVCILYFDAPSGVQCAGSME